MGHTVFFKRVEASSIAQAACTANIVEGVTDPNFGLANIGTHHKQRPPGRSRKIIVALKSNFKLSSTNEVIEA